MPKKVITSEVKIHFLFCIILSILSEWRNYTPLAPSGHFSEMMAKKTGPFGPVLFISEITISPDRYARYDRRTL
ncbi:hypothetical protein CUA56_01555 [Shigella boydii]|nr:hypothetical protein CUA56_01555 [Shigella boydii]